ncbi:hypothetical protein DICVIV_05333 [Dictyocaulus viviparus]|uniref:Uncharacterized protein n=1 Tax=Dictyocaulus viviparus TaxID=29172 RepID=A0A0D8XXI1_DICVI|nr:hypothetical protein DICVIV_05333 [Dictyocaulus viviparus]
MFMITPVIAMFYCIRNSIAVDILSALDLLLIPPNESAIVLAVNDGTEKNDGSTGSNYQRDRFLEKQAQIVVHIMARRSADEQWNSTAAPKSMSITKSSKTANSAQISPTTLDIRKTNMVYRVSNNTAINETKNTISAIPSYSSSHDVTNTSLLEATQAANFLTTNTTTLSANDSLISIPTETTAIASIQMITDNSANTNISTVTNTTNTMHANLTEPNDNTKTNSVSRNANMMIMTGDNSMMSNISNNTSIFDGVDINSTMQTSTNELSYRTTTESVPSDATTMRSPSIFTAPVTETIANVASISEPSSGIQAQFVQNYTTTSDAANEVSSVPTETIALHDVNVTTLKGDVIGSVEVVKTTDEALSMDITETSNVMTSIVAKTRTEEEVLITTIWTTNATAFMETSAPNAPIMSSVASTAGTTIAATSTTEIMSTVAQIDTSSESSTSNNSVVADLKRIIVLWLLAAAVVILAICYVYYDHRRTKAEKLKNAASRTARTKGLRHGKHLMRKNGKKPRQIEAVKINMKEFKRKGPLVLQANLRGAIQTPPRSTISSGFAKTNQKTSSSTAGEVKKLSETTKQSTSTTNQSRDSAEASGVQLQQQSLTK